MDDYISREAAIKYLNTAMFPSDMRYTMAAEIARNIIETLPAADVRPVVRGEWVRRWDGKELECPACTTTFWNEMQGAGPNFCPECGADMRGEAK